MCECGRILLKLWIVVSIIIVAHFLLLVAYKELSKKYPKQHLSPLVENSGTFRFPSDHFDLSHLSLIVKKSDFVVLGAEA